MLAAIACSSQAAFRTLLHSAFIELPASLQLPLANARRPAKLILPMVRQLCGASLSWNSNQRKALALVTLRSMLYMGDTVALPEVIN